MKVREVILTTCWYLWWLRRRRARDEPVPPVAKCKFSILAIVANAEAVKSKRSQPADSKWSKLGPREVKLNVDASFF
jgi:hypothetical protein